MLKVIQFFDIDEQTKELYQKVKSDTTKQEQLSYKWFNNDTIIYNENNEQSIIEFINKTGDSTNCFKDYAISHCTITEYINNFNSISIDDEIDLIELLDVDIYGNINIRYEELAESLINNWNETMEQELFNKGECYLEKLLIQQIPTVAEKYLNEIKDKLNNRKTYSDKYVEYYCALPAEQSIV